METEIKKVGNSLGFIIPSEVIKEQGLLVGETIEVDIKKKQGFSHLFGCMKEELKDVDTAKEFKEMRKEFNFSNFV